MSKISKQSKSNLSKTKISDLISSDSDYDRSGSKDRVNKLLSSSGKKAKAQTRNRFNDKASDVKTLKKSRSPPKQEFLKSRTVTKGTSSNLAINSKASSSKSTSQLRAVAAESLFQEKYVNLKLKSKDMKKTLHEYADRCVHLEDRLHERDW